MKVFKDFIIENFKRPDCSVTKESKRRIEFIDLAKGICILLVVLYHNDITNDIPALKGMRMPLYFILSGLFYKDYKSLFDFVVRKTNRILVPFCFFIVASLVVDKVVTLPGLKYVVLQPFREPQIINFPVWFLLCLFWVNVIFRLIGSFVRRDVVKFCIVLAIGAMGYVLDSYQIYIPLFLNSAFTAMPFFFVGYILRKFPILYRSKHDKIYLTVSVIVAGCIMWLCHEYGTPFIEVVDNKYNGNIFAIYFVSISMVIALLMICKAIRWLPVISYMGRYSIVILGFHALFPKYVNMLFKLIGVTPSRYIYCLVVIIMCWLAIPVCRKLVPSLIAQTDLIRRKENNETLRKDEAENECKKQ